jgi:hypothetical protein
LIPSVLAKKSASFLPYSTYSPPEIWVIKKKEKKKEKEKEEISNDSPPHYKHGQIHPLRQ